MHKQRKKIVVDGIPIDEVTNHEVQNYKYAAKVLRSIKDGSLPVALMTDNLGGLTNDKTMRFLKTLLQNEMIVSTSRWSLVAGEISSGITQLAVTDNGEKLLAIGELNDDKEIKRQIETVNMIVSLLDSYIPK